MRRLGLLWWWRRGMRMIWRSISERSEGGTWYIDISWNFQYIGNTVLNLEWFGVQETRMYQVKFLPEYDSMINVLEWDGWKFVTLKELASMRIAPWTHTAIELLWEYYYSD